MKIIDQLDEDTFTIRVNPVTHRNSNHIVVAHDYVSFFGTTSLFTDPDVFKGPLKGKHAACSNFIWIDTNLQIPIYRFVGGVLPMLNAHKYCQPDHANKYGGSDISFITYYNESGTKMITLFKHGQPSQTLTYEMYELIKGS